MAAGVAFDVEDFVYLRHESGPLRARLFVPAQSGPRPGVVDAHGGRWCSGSRLDNAVIHEGLASSGIVVLALDFRMPPIGGYPLPISDINEGIRWLKKNCGRVGVPEEWVGGLGTSSGGHQMMLNALRPDDERFGGRRDAARSEDGSVAFVALCWPITDPLARYRHVIEKGLTAYVEAHEAYWPDEASMAEGNPQKIVEAGAFSRLPPTFVVQGNKDHILPDNMAALFAEAYRRAGGDLTLFEAPDVGHAFITNEPGSIAATRAIAAIADFIHAQTDARRPMR